MFMVGYQECIILFFTFIFESTKGTTFPQSTVAIPQYLLDVGENIFGSKRSTLEVIGNMSTPRIYKFGGSRTSAKGPMRGHVLATLVQFRDDNTISKLAHEFGKHDKYGLRNITRNTSEIMIDIGANIGLLSIFASKMHRHLSIIAFEAVPTTYFFMRCNLHLNRVRVLNPSDFANGSSNTYSGGVFPVYGAVVGDYGDSSPAKSFSESTIEVRYMNSRSQFAFVASSDPLQNIAHTHQNGVPLEVAKVRAYRLLPFLASLFNPSTVDSKEGPGGIVNVKPHQIASPLPVIALLKIDCEGCEFSVIPSIAELFANRSAVRIVAGEYHVALTDKASATVASKPSEAHLVATAAAMKARGCDTSSWDLMC